MYVGSGRVSVQAKTFLIQTPLGSLSFINPALSISIKFRPSPCSRGLGGGGAVINTSQGKMESSLFQIKETVALLIGMHRFLGLRNVTKYYCQLYGSFPRQDFSTSHLWNINIPV